MEPSAIGMDKAALAALDEVKDGMQLGLGTGRAAEAFIRRLGDAIRGGLRVTCVTTSIRSEKLATELGIPLVGLDEVDRLDAAFDGADEVTPDLDLTKGLGGAALRERVVAHAATRFVVLVTPEKLVPRLGTRAPIPVEVIPFARAVVARDLAGLGAEPVLRRAADGAPFVTDNGGYILDARTGPVDDPQGLDEALREIPGVMGHGVFVAMADRVLVGGDTDVEIRDRKR
jgi:ribose 5-phosphate isomerase A